MEDIEEVDESLEHFSLDRLKHIQDVMAVEIMKSFNLWKTNQQRLARVSKEIERRKNEGNH